MYERDTRLNYFHTSLRYQKFLDRLRVIILEYHCKQKSKNLNLFVLKQSLPQGQRVFDHTI